MERIAIDSWPTRVFYFGDDGAKGDATGKGDAMYQWFWDCWEMKDGLGNTGELRLVLEAGCTQAWSPALVVGGPLVLTRASRAASRGAPRKRDRACR